MGQYEWTFVVETMSDESVESIYADFDATASSHGGCELLTLTLGGPSASDAAKSAITTLNDRYSVQVVRSYPDLVTRADIAERLEVTIHTVDQWVRGDRWKDKLFPGPFNLVGGGIWLWGDVQEWLRSVGKATAGELAYPGHGDHADVDAGIDGGKGLGVG